MSRDAIQIRSLAVLLDLQELCLLLEGVLENHLSLLQGLDFLGAGCLAVIVAGTLIGIHACWLQVFGVLLGLLDLVGLHGLLIFFLVLSFLGLCVSFHLGKVVLDSLEDRDDASWLLVWVGNASVTRIPSGRLLAQIHRLLNELPRLLWDLTAALVEILEHRDGISE